MFKTDLEDEEYLKTAERLGLPEFAREPGFKLWKFSVKRPQLKLWKNESIVLGLNNLWINLAMFPRNNPLATVADLSWMIEYWTKRTMYGFTVGESPRTPIPRPGSGEGSSTKIWHVCCTNARLISYRICRGTECHLLHFPWSMFSGVKSSQYDTRFFSRPKHLLELSFGLGDTSYLFVLGPLEIAEASAYARSIHETALNAKAKWTEMGKLHSISAERGKRLGELSAVFSQELAGKVAEKPGIVVEKDGVYFHQTYLPSLNPFEYYDMMRKQEPAPESENKEVG